jgi:hypothetical protein
LGLQDAHLPNYHTNHDQNSLFNSLHLHLFIKLQCSAVVLKLKEQFDIVNKHNF